MTSAPVEDAENGPGESLSPLGHGPAQDSEAVGVVVPAHRRRRSPFRVLLELLRSAVLVLLLFFLVRALAVEAFRIPTSSMEGTLLAGDFLLVNKAAYGAEIPGLGLSLPALDEPDRGDVIVFRPPHEPRKHYVKRLLGLPGDTLEMRAKELFLNGAPVVEPYARYLDPEGDVVHPRMSWQARFLASPRTHPRYRPTRDNWGPLIVPEHRYFVLGDNRDNSEDSRYWGFVRREAIEGRPWFVYYSTEPRRTGALSVLRDVRWGRIGGVIR